MSMEVFPDFEDWLACLRKTNADFVVVGGYAVGHHGHPRYTGDLDIFFGCDSDNVDRLLQALEDFGFAAIGLTAEDLVKPGNVIQLGNPPAQIDLLNRLTGLTWEQATADRSPGQYGKVSVDFLGLQALLQNKRATGRTKDAADVEELDPKTQ